MAANDERRVPRSALVPDCWARRRGLIACEPSRPVTRRSAIDIADGAHQVGRAMMQAAGRPRTSARVGEACGPPPPSVERCAENEQLALFTPPWPRCTRRQGRDANTPRETPTRVSPLFWLFLCATARKATHAVANVAVKRRRGAFVACSSPQFLDMRIVAQRPHPNSRTRHDSAF